MLKALEVHGFKSFADKTRFEFPAGITVVVGPNGSGKSNVVDAIKWVLGEQSAKSLRGKDMADVIFKGSGSAASGRKPLNTAEATIVFDNADRRLPIDAPEVHVTRRVYRSGEGEYLINREPCRLKDIKDLFRGTGVGGDSYSIIEQGKVEKLLQASAKDRRSMFEEAAGISRFKAKKVETLRRLERVDQNLLRLRDIVDEVDARLKSVRAQASKAKRYREYDERLKFLRTLTAGGDWRKLHDKREKLRSQVESRTARLEQSRLEADEAERAILDLERSLSAAQDELRQTEARSARNREAIATRDGARDFDRARIGEWDEEIARSRRQTAGMMSKVGSVRSQLREIVEQLAVAEAEHLATSSRVAEQERRTNESAQEQAKLRKEIERERREYVRCIRESAELGNRAGAAATQQEQAQQAVTRCEDRLATVEASLASYSDERDALLEAQRLQAEVVEERRQTLESLQLELDTFRLALAERQEDLSHLRSKFNGASERSLLLKDLEQRREGLELGVKEFLASRRDREGAVLEGVRGMVADVLSASTATAALIDLALGDLSQAIVIDTDDMRRRVLGGEVETKGRLLFVGLWSPHKTMDDELDLRGRTGVIDRADRLVHSLEGFASLATQLLGNTWLVETLDDAVRLRAEGATGVRFVARSGERLETDGTLVVGAGRGTAGLISRRSELRTLEADIGVYQRLIAESEEETQRLRVNITAQEIKVRHAGEEHRTATLEGNDRQVAVRSHEQRGERLREQQATLRNEQKLAHEQAATAEGEIRRLRGEQESVEKTLRETEAAIQSGERRIEEEERRRQAVQQEVTAARVELARSEQRVDALRLRRFQCEEDERERDRLLEEARRQLTDCLVKKETAERAILTAGAELAELFGEKERLADAIDILAKSCESLAADRTRRTETLQTHRKTVRSLEDDLQEDRLKLGSLDHEMQTLVDRMRDDYGLDVTSVEQASSDAEQRPREEIEEEMNALRRKIHAIGAVNLDALAELDDLESRYQTLSSQYDDLSGAKQSLEKIIHKINADSRRIFLETLESIRTNFQALYRRAFGGGKADLALEEGVDVLESGVEILATPPGKPSFNNSLLSGGEKALTAVALLLAIFQFRPSPFCVLDEVDAPFDEANIGRFMGVLKDFLGWTRFIIVTHSKKTMTAADTLYGVTMQESGVSKRVSVRFEDVSEDGRISKEAVERESESERGVA